MPSQGFEQVVLDLGPESDKGTLSGHYSPRKGNASGTGWGPG